MEMVEMLISYPLIPSSFLFHHSTAFPWRLCPGLS